LHGAPESYQKVKLAGTASNIIAVQSLLDVPHTFIIHQSGNQLATQYPMKRLQAAWLEENVA